jgi:hypothetical protein
MAEVFKDELPLEPEVILKVKHKVCVIKFSFLVFSI